MKKSSRHSKMGFNLVEVALAILVVAIGMLGLVALLPIGLTASREAASDTELSMLAHSINTSLSTFLASSSTNRIANFEFTYNGSTLSPGSGNRTVFTKADGFTLICGALLRPSDVPNSTLNSVSLELYPGNRTARPITFTTLHNEP